MKTIRLDGVVGYDILASDVSRELKNQSEIKLIINSGGGDIIEGFSIYNLLNDFSGSVNIQIDFAASMASVIAMAGDTVTMKDSSSIMMIHRPWGMSGGNSEDLRKHADNLDKMEGMLLDIYIAKSGINRDLLSQLLADETYLDAKEAKSYGLIDEIESGSQDFAMVAMSGMKAQSKVDFDSNKLVAKIEAMKGGKKPVKGLFDSVSTLSDVECVMRQEFSLSRAEATAIVSAVKKIDHGDHDKQETVNLLKNLSFKNI